MDAHSNEHDSMQDFFAPPKGRRIAIFIFAAVLAAVVIGVFAIERKPLEEPVRLTHSLDKGTYSYLDVQLLSDWLIKATGEENYTYYAAMDPDGNWFIVSLDDDAAGRLDACYAAYQYYYSEDAPYAELPEPYRLYGVTGTVQNDDLSSLATYFDATQAEFSDYFGGGYFNEGARPSNDWEAALLAAGVFSLLFLLVLIAQAGVFRSNYKKSDERLYALGKCDDAAREFASANNLRFKRAKLVLSENFLFSGVSGAVVPYEDVLWVYKRVQRSYGVAVATSLNVGLIDGRSVALAARGVTDELTEQAAAAVRRKNPGAVFGYSAEKRRQYRRAVKEYKQNRERR